MSLARSRTAVMSATFTRLMIGLPATILSRSVTGPSSTASRSTTSTSESAQRGEERIDVDFAAGILLDELADVALQRQHGADFAPGDLPKPVDGGQRLRLGHCDGERVAHLEHRDDQQPLGFFFADELHQCRIDQPVAQMARRRTPRLCPSTCTRAALVMTP